VQDKSADSSKTLKNKGRATQIHTQNRFEAQQISHEHDEALDLEPELEQRTEFIEVFPKTIINQISSPDIPVDQGLNPYQGCEHGCAYCFARPTHAFWGYNPGIDFESRILYKQEAADLLEQSFQKKSYQVKPLMLSGNTDCYQPVERKLKITRSVLEMLLAYQHPVSIITKNALLTRDLDLLTELARKKLVHVNISLTTFNEKIRASMEPRTSSTKKKLQAIEKLVQAEIPVNLMLAPVIPALTHPEIPEILKTCSELGVSDAGMSMLRLNGETADIFCAWIKSAFPEKAERVIEAVKSVHGDKLHEYKFGQRMRGQGALAESIRHLFKISKRKYFKKPGLPPLDDSIFLRPGGEQLRLF
jgi:DNA repair photolyase